jgi:hypothetical protein
MTYCKPVIAVVGSAVDAVQATIKNGQPNDLGDPSMTTVSAYEADE